MNLNTVTALEAVFTAVREIDKVIYQAERTKLMGIVAGSNRRK